MDELKETIAKNLVQLRTEARLTQLQLAEMLNYSDKAVSKWERGDAIPDLRVLIKLANIYNITVDDLISSSAHERMVKPKMNTGKKRALIIALSVGLCWFVATVLFMIFFFIHKTEHYAYLAFTFAPFASAVVLTVFSAKWGNWWTNMLACSFVLWSAVLILHIFVIAFTDFRKIYFLYIVAGVFEILIILWFTLRRLYKHKK